MKKRELEEEEIFDEDEDDFDSDEYSDIPNIKVDADDFEVKDETLDQIKKRFLEIGKKEKSIQQEDLLEATAHLDLSDEDIESLIEFFKNKNIKVESDEDEVSNLDDLDRINFSLLNGWFQYMARLFLYFQNGLKYNRLVILIIFCYVFNYAAIIN